jgi:hypothetical protein
MSRLVAGAAAVLVVVLAVNASATTYESAAEREVYEAMARAPTISKQAENLAFLAWPKGNGDEEVAAVARRVLVGFGGQGMAALRGALRKVDPEDQADVVRAILEARDRIVAGIPADLLPALEEAVWFGTHDARAIAIPELGRYQASPALLTIIDAGHEDPELVGLAVDAVGMIGDERGRFFLDAQLHGGAPGIPEKAAVALARTGGKALDPLKAAIRSDDRALRELAVRALLPVAGVEELSTLYEYTYRHEDDDPELIEAVRQSTVVLERLLAAQQDHDSASPMPE